VEPARGIAVERLVRTGSRHTVTKTRVLAGGLHTRKQQMIRIDRENDGPTQPEDRERLLQAAVAAVARADALVVSDYSDGSLSTTYAKIAAEAAQLGKVVVVDSRTALSQFHGVTVVKGNEPEFETALGVEIKTADAAAAAAEAALRAQRLGAAVITRGREGMAIASARGRSLIPAHGSGEAVDVTGAGDTVAAVLALALSAGASILEAAVLANCAGALAVQQLGAATLSQPELLSTLASLAAETVALLGSEA
jgi:rfaE bifunctional protein kinase chain/domain